MDGWKSELLSHPDQTQKCNPGTTKYSQVSVTKTKTSVTCAEIPILKVTEIKESILQVT